MLQTLYSGPSRIERWEFREAQNMTVTTYYIIFSETGTLLHSLNAIGPEVNVMRSKFNIL